MQDAALIPFLSLISLMAFVPLIVIKIPGFRVPTAILEILLGMIIGKSGTQLFLPTPFLQHLSDLGLMYLMFLAGTEIQIRPKSGSSGGSSVIAVLFFAITLTSSALMAWMISNQTIDSTTAMITLLLTTTSLGIVVPVLRENGLLSSSYGQTVLQAALLADIGTLLLLSVLLSFTSPLNGEASLSSLLVLGLSAILFYQSAKFIRHWVYDVRKKLPGAQIGIRATFSLLGSMLLITHFLHIELLIGAFAAGIVLTLFNKGEHKVLHDKLEGIGYGFLFPIFFVYLGMSFDLQKMNSAEALMLVPLLLVCAYLVKLLGALAFFLRFSKGQTIRAGVLLSTNFTLVIAVASLGVKLGILAPAVESAFIVVALCTVLLSPLLFGYWQNRHV